LHATACSEELGWLIEGLVVPAAGGAMAGYYLPGVVVGAHDEIGFVR